MPGTITVSPTGNQDINGLLYSQKWAVNSFSYSFPTSASFYQAGSTPNGETTNNFAGLNATQQNYVRSAFQHYSSVANLSFSETVETSSQHADLRFARTDVTSTAWAYLPYSGAAGGDSWYHTSGGIYDNPVRGNYAAHTFLHEMGHALGLVHGHDTSNPFGALPAGHDSLEYSVMTYRSYAGAALSGYTYETWGAPQTLMQDDIAALQYLYGANFNTNSGNTTYSWSASTGQMFVNGVGQDQPGGNRVFMTVWDGGGVDTYDFSNYGTNLTVNLLPGAWTTASSTQVARLGSGVYAAGNVASALLYNGDLRSLIENAVGGGGNDTFHGNVAANTIWGGGGNDWVLGAGGNDVLYGQSGSDTASFSGTRSQYATILLSDGSLQLTDSRSGSPDGVDILWDFEWFQFQDGTLDYQHLLYQPPVATISDHTLAVSQAALVTNWITYSDSQNRAAAVYEFWDSGAGAGSGYFSTAGNAHHSVGVAITVNAADLNNVYVHGGQTGGSETMWVRAYNGTEWSAYDSFTLTTLRNTAPVAAMADHSLGINQSSTIASWISYVDAENSAATTYEFWDGGTAATSAYFSTPGTPQHGANVSILVNASDLNTVTMRGGQVAGSETMWMRASDGSDWSAWDAFTFTTLSNTAPVAAMADHSLGINQSSAIASWISYVDAENSAATMYEFWDGGTAATSAYFSTPGTPQHAANVSILVNASDLNTVTMRGGQVAGSEAMWMRASDGSDWSAWDAFTFTTLPNTPPVATISDHTLGANHSSSVASWISYSDPANHPATVYEFWDSGTAANSGYFSTLGNAHNSAGVAITVNAADLTNVSVHGGQSGGSETMWVRAFNGTDWSAYDSFTLTTLSMSNTAPVAAMADHSLGINQSSMIASWISYVDAENSAATMYEFWDGGTAATSAYFSTPGTPQHAANTSITVNAADLNSVTIRGGQVAGSEAMWMRAFDGTDWSTWDAFTFTTLSNAAPVATISDHVLGVNEVTGLASWISYFDADNNAATMYEIWDSGADAGSGYFSSSGVAQYASKTAIVVNAGVMGSMLVHGGQTGGSETMWVRAFDGTEWSAYDAFTLTTAPAGTIPEVEDFVGRTGGLGHTAQSGNGGAFDEFSLV